MPILDANVAQFTFDVDGLESELGVIRFTGTEELSRLFRFTLDLASEDGEIDFAQVVGQPAVLTVFGEQGDRYVNGIVSRFEQSGEVGRFALYTAELVPQFWLFMHRRKSRIFQKMSVPDIIEKVLGEGGLSSDRYRFVLRDRGLYSLRDFCVQYRESEFTFLSRLMEEEGIFYFFEHMEDQHVLVMGDHAAAHRPIPDPVTVLYHDPTGLVPAEESIVQFRYGEEIRPGAVMLGDFDFQQPSLTPHLRVQVQADVRTELEAYDYPGAYTEPQVGSRLAQVRLEELQASRKVGRGQGVCRRLIPGFYFTLDHYPRSALNQEYLMTAVRHKAEQPQVLEERAGEEGLKYTNDFACIPLSVPFRPQRNTSRPIIRGTQTAIVVGPDAEEIYTDDEGHGRVKVQFHWDREGQYNQDSSCWVRVSQLWAGAGWGGMSLPRIGQEVIVEFLEGDPDLPIIIGRVYNADQMPPYPLPAKRTQSGIKSRSSKGGTPENFNEIRFEDQKGSEEMYLHAEKDQTMVVENDKTENIGHDETESVGHDETISIGNDRTETVGNNETISIGANRTETVGANESITVAQNRTRNVGQNEVVNVALTRTHNVGVNEMINVGAAQEVAVGGAQTITVGLERAVTVGLNQDVNIGNNLRENIGNNHQEDVGDNRTTSVGKNLTINAGEQIVIRTGEASITMTADGTIEINGGVIKIGGSKIEAVASTIELEGGQEFKVQAAIIKLN